MVAANPAGPLNCEVDIFRLAVRKKNCLRHKLFSSNDGRYQQREKSQHCFQFLESTYQPFPQLHNFRLDLSSSQCLPALLSRLHPARGHLVGDQRNCGSGRGGEPLGHAIFIYTCMYTCIPVRHIHIYLCTCNAFGPLGLALQNQLASVTSASYLGQCATCLLQAAFLNTFFYLWSLWMFVGWLF